MGRYKPIKAYEYKTNENSSIRVLNHDGSEYLFLKGTDIKKISFDTKTGNILIISEILGNSSEFKFMDWKRNSKDLIKTVELLIVKAGHGRFYKLDVGIQMIHDDYGRMETMIVLKHDTVESPLFHSIKPLDYGLYADIKIDKRDIDFKNISNGTMINLGLSSLALALAIPTGGASLTLPVTITIAISGSAYVSAYLDFSFELMGNIEEYKGKTNILQQLAGEIGKAIDQYSSSSEMKREARYEKNYDNGITFLGLISGIQGIKSLTNLKNFKALSKSYNSKTYIKLQNIKINGSPTFQGLEGAKRSLNKNKLTSDVLNSYGTFQEAKKWK